MSEKLGCTFCKAEPSGKYWYNSKVKLEVFGSSMEFRVCPDCRKKIGQIPCSAWIVLNTAFTKARDELADRVAHASN